MATAVAYGTRWTSEFVHFHPTLERTTHLGFHVSMVVLAIVVLVLCGLKAAPYLPRVVLVVILPAMNPPFRKKDPGQERHVEGEGDQR